MEQQLKLSTNTAKLHQMFGKKLYSDRYSFISEICQNAVDSHRMSGQKDPVVVGIKMIGGKYVFYVKDTGLSFDSKEDFISKVCTILESGKSEEKTDNEETPMGEHGIGSISVSAYQPEWSYTIVKSGRKFKATLREVEGKGLVYEIGNYQKTDEDKYVLFEVEVPSMDIVQVGNPLIEAIKRKLCYFKDIMFEFDPSLLIRDSKLLTLNTEFEIFQSDDFQISTLSKSDEIHVCLDQYFYAINWQRLGISPIKLNIGLRFSLVDGLHADITRENLQYTDDYVDIIKKKIGKVAEWFVNRYNNSIPDEFTSIKEYIANNGLEKYVTLNNVAYPINALVATFSGTSIKKTRFKDVSPEIVNHFINVCIGGRVFYNFTGEISASGNKIKGSPWRAYQHSQMILLDSNKAIPTKIASYMRTAYKGAGLYTRRNIKMLKGEIKYKDLLLLESKAQMSVIYKSSGINLWRKKIEQMKLLEESYERDTFIKVGDIVVPSTFAVAARKTPNRKEKISLEDMSGEIGIRYPKRMSTWNADWLCKFDEKTLKIRDLYRQPRLHIYGNEADRFKLDLLYRLATTSGQTKITPCIITDRQQNFVKRLKLHNFMHVDEYFKGKHDSLRCVVTAFLIYKLSQEHYNIFANKDIIKRYLSSKFAEDLDILEAYHKKYGIHYVNHSAFMEDLLKLAEEAKLYDLQIWERFNKVKADISKFDFVQFFTSQLHAAYKGHLDQEISLKAIQDIARYRKIHMDWKYYKMDFDDTNS